MKLKLTLCLLLFSLWARPCGYFYDDDNYFYYNVFAQTTIEDPGLYPFLNDSFNRIFDAGEENIQMPYKGNFKLWQKILTDWSIEDLKKVLNNSSNEEFDQLWKTKGNKKEEASREYMETARSCADSFAYRSSPSWEYDEILRNREVDVNPLLQKTMSGFEKVKNEQLKARYAYQILRLFHYSKQYDDAISFYNQNVKDKFAPNEIYYYCMDQVAGCYYSKREYEESAYLFLQVFDKSIDRKESAALSYRFCDINGADASQILKTGADSIAWYSLQAWRGYNSFDAFKKACAIDPSNPKTELLFMLALNKWEQERWLTGAGIQGVPDPPTNEDVKGKIQELAEIADSLYAIPKISNRDFWLISASYLDFMAGNLADAKRKLANVKSEHFSKQKDILAKVYEVFGWKEVSTSEESYIVENLKDVFKIPIRSEWDDMHNSAWEYFIIDQIAHLLYHSDKLAEAFLCQNNLVGLEQISSEKLISDLQHFFEKKNKSEFENMLATRGERTPDEALAYVYEAEGLYYLQKADPQKALSFFEKSDLIPKRFHYSANSDTQTGISALIFSNNTMECFHCDKNIVMTDSVFLAGVFDFIKPHFDKTGLTRNLLKLDSLAKGSTKWKAKLANYLLANYYFNVSNTGYFRGTLSNRGNCCESYYGINQNEGNSSADWINEKHGFNLSNVSDYPSVYFGLAQEASAFYQKVLDNSSDPELNARCLYMMAKCELNEMYAFKDMDYYGYDGGNVDDQYHSSFKTLKEDYTQTNFYQQTIKECSFFRYYVSL